MLRMPYFLKYLVRSSFGLAAFAVSGSLHAQILANPAMNAQPGHVLADGGLMFQKVQYQYGRENSEIERRTMFAAFGFALNPKVDIFGQLGYSFNSQFRDNTDIKGTGYIFGFGPRFAPYWTKSIRVEGYGLFNMTNDEMSGSDIKVEQNITDIHLGGATSFISAPNIRPFVGLDFVVSSDGKLKSKTGAFSESNVQRDDKISLDAGINFPFNNVGFRPEVLIAGETTLMLGLWSFL